MYVWSVCILVVVPCPAVSGCIYKCSECVGMTLSDQIGHRTLGSYIILTLATTTSTIRYTLRPRNMQIRTRTDRDSLDNQASNFLDKGDCNVSVMQGIVSVMQYNVPPHSPIIKSRVFTSPGAPADVCSSLAPGSHVGWDVIVNLPRTS